jgi:tRNA(Ile)-lysidine synthase
MNFLNDIKTLFSMHAKGKKVICACSGGVDSMVMSFFLKQFCDISLIYVVIVDHKLRDNSSLEAQNTKSAVLKMGFKNVVILTWHHEKVDFGVEEKARIARQKLIFEYAILNNIDTVFFGHHFNDLEENFFLKIGMGGGLPSLFSMQNVKKYRYNGRFFNIIRPLLLLSKIDIVNFAKDNNIFFSEDESNESNDFKRNRIRKKLHNLEISKTQFLNTAKDANYFIGVVKNRLSQIFNSIILFNVSFGYFSATIKNLENIDNYELGLCLKQIIFYLNEKCEVRRKELETAVYKIRINQAFTLGGMEVFFNKEDIFFIKEVKKINNCIKFNYWDLRFEILEEYEVGLPKLHYKIIRTLPFVKKNIEKDYYLSYNIKTVDFVII